MKAPRYARYGINMPTETPSWPWEVVTVVFVSDLPESMASGYTSIHLIVDQPAGIAIYTLCWKDIDSPELAWLFFDHIT